MEKNSSLTPLWEKFQDQKFDPWPFLDFEEYKKWSDKQEKVKSVYSKKVHKDFRSN